MFAKEVLEFITEILMLYSQDEKLTKNTQYCDDRGLIEIKYMETDMYVVEFTKYVGFNKFHKKFYIYPFQCAKNQKEMNGYYFGHSLTSSLSFKKTLNSEEKREALIFYLYLLTGNDENKDKYEKYVIDIIQSVKTENNKLNLLKHLKIPDYILTKLEINPKRYLIRDV